MLWGTRVVGLASTVLFDKTNPKSPLNRRISIIVLSRQALASFDKERYANDKWRLKNQNDPQLQPPNKTPVPSPVTDTRAHANETPAVVRRNHHAQGTMPVGPAVSEPLSRRDTKPKHDNPKKTKKIKKSEGGAKRQKVNLPKIQLDPIIDPRLLPNQ